MTAKTGRLDAFRKKSGAIDYKKLAARMADENRAGLIEPYLRSLFRAGGVKPRRELSRLRGKSGKFGIA